LPSNPLPGSGDGSAAAGTEDAGSTTGAGGPYIGGSPVYVSVGSPFPLPAGGVVGTGLVISYTVKALVIVLVKGIESTLPKNSTAEEYVPGTDVTLE
jgi:hypothetical protein